MKGNVLRSFHNSRAIALAAIISPLLLAGCGGSSGGDGDGSVTSGGDGGDSITSDGACSGFDCTAMLSNLGENVMQPAMEDFQARAQTLEDRANSYRQSLVDDGNDEDQAAKEDFRTAWEEAIQSWQSIDVMQVGPLVDNSGALRDNIYSWPAKSTCSVDNTVIDANEEPGFDITNSSVLGKGLDALEYILFSDSLEVTTGCPAEDEWADKTDPERREYRAVYAEAAAEALSDRADELVAAWTGDDGFQQELANPGTGNSRFETELEAVNAVSDALFYIEKQVKDIKLAVPLCGNKRDCPDSGEVTPEEVENPFSERSKPHIRENVIAFQTLFLGNEAGASVSRQGFDDLLDAANEENISSMMETDIQETLNDLDGIGEGVTLTQALQPDNTAGEDAVRDVWESAQDITDRLKNDFLQALMLSIPDSAAGDGD